MKEVFNIVAGETGIQINLNLFVHVNKQAHKNYIF
jgi:hypothetical protein